MPIYVYKCEEKHQTEELKKFSENTPSIICPACGKTALKVFSPSGAFRLKGLGWARDGYNKIRDAQGNAPSKGDKKYD